MTPHQHHLGREAARRLTLDADPFLSCDDCFDQVDAAVERLVEERRPLTRAFRAHLLGCPACHEEARTLATLVADQRGRDAGHALRLLDRELEP